MAEPVATVRDIAPFLEGVNKWLSGFPGDKALIDADQGRAMDTMSVDQFLKDREQILLTYVYRGALDPNGWWVKFAPFERTSEWNHTTTFYYSQLRPWRHLTQEVLAEMTPIQVEKEVEGLQMFGQIQMVHLNDLMTEDGRAMFWEKMRHLASNLRVTFRFLVEAALSEKPSFFISLVQDGIDGVHYPDLLSAYDFERQTFLGPHRADVGLVQVMGIVKDMIRRGPGPKPNMAVLPSRFREFAVTSSPGFELRPHERGDAIANQQMATGELSQRVIAGFEIAYDEEELGYDRTLQAYSNSFRITQTSAMNFVIDGMRVADWLPELRDGKTDLDFLLSIQIPGEDGPYTIRWRDEILNALPYYGNIEGSEDESFGIDWDPAADLQEQEWKTLKAHHRDLDYSWPWEREEDFLKRATTGYGGKLRWAHLFGVGDKWTLTQMTSQRRTWEWLRLHARTAAIALRKRDEKIDAMVMTALTAYSSKAGNTALVADKALETALVGFAQEVYSMTGADAELAVVAALGATETLRKKTSKRAIWGVRGTAADLDAAAAELGLTDASFAMDHLFVSTENPPGPAGKSSKARSAKSFGHAFPLSWLEMETRQLSHTELVCAVLMLLKPANKLFDVAFNNDVPVPGGDGLAQIGARDLEARELIRMVDFNALPPKSSLLALRFAQSLNTFALAYLAMGAGRTLHGFASTVMGINPQTNLLLVNSTLFAAALIPHKTSHFLHPGVFSMGGQSGWGGKVLDPTKKEDAVHKLEVGTVQYPNGHADILVTAITGYTREELKPSQAVQIFGTFNPQFVAKRIQWLVGCPHLKDEPEFPGGRWFGKRQFGIDLTSLNEGKHAANNSLRGQDATVSNYDGWAWIGTQFDPDPLTRQFSIQRIGNHALARATVPYRQIFSRIATVRDDKFLDNDNAKRPRI